MGFNSGFKGLTAAKFSVTSMVVNEAVLSEGMRSCSDLT